MTTPIVPNNTDLNTVTLRAKINELRIIEHEQPVRNDKFLARVVDECPELADVMVEMISTINEGTGRGKHSREVAGLRELADQVRKFRSSSVYRWGRDNRLS